MQSGQLVFGVVVARQVLAEVQPKVVVCSEAPLKGVHQQHQVRVLRLGLLEGTVALLSVVPAGMWRVLKV